MTVREIRDKADLYLRDMLYHEIRKRGFDIISYHFDWIEDGSNWQFVVKDGRAANMCLFLITNRITIRIFQKLRVISGLTYSVFGERDISDLDQLDVNFNKLIEIDKDNDMIKIYNEITNPHLSKMGLFDDDN